MCIFQARKFKLYPESTRLHLGYQEPDETSRDWTKRAKLEQRERNAENQERNALAELKAAERKADYSAETEQPKYIVYTNPTPSEEPGAEHRKYWVVDTTPRDFFVAPGIIVEGTDSRETAEYWRDYHAGIG